MTTNELPAVVFLHGWLMGPWMWTEAAGLLSYEGRLDFITEPSHGASSLPEGSTMADWSDWLAGELRTRGVERAVLVGHSMGGILTIETLRRHPGLVAGVCLVSTTDKAWPEEVQKSVVDRARALSGWNETMAAQTASALLGSEFLHRQPEWLGWWAPTVAAYDLAGSVSVAAAFARRDDHSDITSGYQGPSIVIHGDADRAIPLAAGQEMAARLRAPLVVIHGAGHAPALEAPAEFAKALDRFLRESFGG